MTSEHTPPTTTEIPIQSSNAPIPITLHLPQSTAAIKIQSAYRAHLIRTHFKTIAAVHSEADEFQRLIQRQETVDSVRTSEREKLRMNESLMRLLLKLDSDPTVREARRKVSRRIVDAIISEDVDGFWGGRDDGFGRNWDDILAEMKEEACRDKGGEEMERLEEEACGIGGKNHIYHPHLASANKLTSSNSPPPPTISSTPFLSEESNHTLVS
ncbi:hypothetical protein ACFX13_025339 [Malus domestica]